MFLQLSPPTRDRAVCFHSTRETGPCPCIRAGETVARRHRAPTLQCRSWFPVTRLKRKERRYGFSAIRMRSLNDPCQGSLPTVLLHLHQVQTVTSVTIRPPIPTPAQRVSHI